MRKLLNKPAIYSAVSILLLLGLAGQSLGDTISFDATGMYPPMPNEYNMTLRSTPDFIGSDDPYDALLRTICGATDDSQPVEQYDGTLGVTKQFVDTHEQKVGQIQWNDNLSDLYDEPGNISGVRWCTGTLISADLFLTAGHCFDQSGGGWQRPKIDGTDDVISPEEIATNMHVNFNYQVDQDDNLRQEIKYDIDELVEYRLGDLDFSIVRLADSPGEIFGIGILAQEDAEVGDMIAIIGHPAGEPKRIEAGPVTSFEEDRIRYNDIDTLGGNSGSALWHSPSGKIVGVHTNGGCSVTGGSNFGVRIGSLLEESTILQDLAMHPPSSVINVDATGLIIDKPMADHRDVASFRMTGVTDIETVAKDAAAAGTPLSFEFPGYSFTGTGFDAAGNRMIYSDDEGNMVRCIFSKEICTVKIRYVDFDGEALDNLLPGNMTVSFEIGDTNYTNTGDWTQIDSGSGTWTKYRKDN
ncbi:MAG: trypsin-like serine peptidase [Candidatus Electrothrix sp. YB6]